MRTRTTLTALALTPALAANANDNFPRPAALADADMVLRLTVDQVSGTPGFATGDMFFIGFDIDFNAPDIDADPNTTTADAAISNGLLTSGGNSIEFSEGVVFSADFSRDFPNFGDTIDILSFDLQALPQLSGTGPEIDSLTISLYDLTASTYRTLLADSQRDMTLLEAVNITPSRLPSRHWTATTPSGSASGTLEAQFTIADLPPISLVTARREIEFFGIGPIEPSGDTTNIKVLGLGPRTATYTNGATAFSFADAAPDGTIAGSVQTGRFTEGPPSNRARVNTANATLEFTLSPAAAGTSTYRAFIESPSGTPSIGLRPSNQTQSILPNSTSITNLPGGGTLYEGTLQEPGRYVFGGGSFQNYTLMPFGSTSATFEFSLNPTTEFAPPIFVNVNDTGRNTVAIEVDDLDSAEPFSSTTTTLELPPARNQAVLGTYDNVIGTVTVQREGGFTGTLTIEAFDGLEILLGDCLFTGDSSSVDLLFSDGQSFTFPANASRKFLQYSYRPRDTSGPSGVNIAESVLVFLEGVAVGFTSLFADKPADPNLHDSLRRYGALGGEVTEIIRNELLNNPNPDIGATGIWVETASPVSVSTSLPLPDEAFTVAFKYAFLDPEGSLSASLDGVTFFQDSATAPEVGTEQSAAFVARAGTSAAELKFTLDAATAGQSAVIYDLNIDGIQFLDFEAWNREGNGPAQFTLVLDESQLDNLRTLVTEPSGQYPDIAEPFGTVNALDAIEFINRIENANPNADVDESGTPDFFDQLQFLRDFDEAAG